MKTAVIYWSGTGNTEAMAKAVAEGAGAELFAVSDFSGSVDDYDSIADYGLDQPQNTITVTCGNETTTIDIGDYNEMLQEYYIKISGDDKIYLADSTLKDAFSKKPDTMVQQEESTETESVDSTQS